ncbi:MAG TPA: hypothetical protein VHZ74_23180 [Bryobacteraceae bacterium]|jgi:hypothetical protein|nr:hypothetical protein [Bryobacteraceae bacterium]
MASPQQVQLADLPVTGIVGPFAERLLREFVETTRFDDLTVEPESIELGEDVINQTVVMDFRVSFPGAASREVPVAGGRMIIPNGPLLTYSFCPGDSVAENLNAFKEFVRQHAGLAANPPATRHGASPGPKTPSNHQTEL